MTKDKVIDIIIPTVILIIVCVVALVYNGNGNSFSGLNVIDAFSNTDATVGLPLGAIIAIVVCIVYFIIRRIVSFKGAMDAIPEGFKAMVPAILILTFAWTISGIMGAKGGYLDAQAFVQNNVEKIPSTLMSLFPVIFFVLACGIAFATGTSWGTFGVLVPIAVTVLGGGSTLAVLTVSATLGGAVFGDHVSPISDTTIMASTGAACNHIDHVKTQLPYAAVVAIIAALSYVVAGFVASLGGVLCALIMWVVVAVLFVGTIYVLKKLDAKK